ncbi:MAG TPA: molybdate ABC transporter permease subunit [Blastocatellia bacterium]|nr:molybdate ABC transporter permease subunit [Blastocatellia bacterium]
MPFDWFPIRLSLQVALLATLLALAAGVAGGWLLARRDFRGREWLDAAFSLPLVLPPTVLGYYLLVLLGQSSPLGRGFEAVFGFRLIFTWQAAVVAATIHALPLVVRSSRAAFEGVAPQLEQAARTLGASEWEIFRRVTLPLARRGVLAAATLAFARALGDFGATLMVAGNIPGRTQTAAVAIYDAVQAGREGQALTLSVVISALALVLLYLANKLK